MNVNKRKISCILQPSNFLDVASPIWSMIFRYLPSDLHTFVQLSYVSKKWSLHKLAHLMTPRIYAKYLPKIAQWKTLRNLSILFQHGDECHEHLSKYKWIVNLQIQNACYLNLSSFVWSERLLVIDSICIDLPLSVQYLSIHRSKTNLIECRMPNLVDLELQNVDITGAELKCLHHSLLLKNIRLHKCVLIYSLSKLSGCLNLRSLTIESENIINGLEKCTQLTCVQVNSLDSFKNLQEFKNVKTLTLMSKVNLFELIPKLKYFPKLNVLSIRDNNFTTLYLQDFKTIMSQIKPALKIDLK